MTDKKKYSFLILSFFVFATLFPTLRLLIIGNGASTTISQYLFSALPDIFALVVLAYVSVHLFKSKTSIKIKPLDWAVIFFWLTNVIIGFIISGNLIISAYGFRMTYFPLCFYVVFRFCNDDLTERTLHKVFRWLLLIGIIGIVLYTLFYDQMVYMIHLSQPEAAVYFVIRMTSLFWTPVVFSTVMSATLLYFTYYFYSKGKWHYFIYMTLLVFCIIMSVSRGAMIASLISFVLISALSRSWERSFYASLMIIAVYFTTSFYIASPGEFLRWITDSTMETVMLKKGVSRTELWFNAFSNFNSHPLGYGLGKAGHIAHRFYSEGSTRADIFSTDGWFLKLANETGLWGLISYFCLMILYLITVLKRKLYNYRHSLNILFFSIVVLVNVQNFVSNVLDFYMFSFLFWTIFGASVKLMYEYQKQ